MGNTESKIEIVDAFGVGKHHCPQLHQTEGFLRLTVNDIRYEACPQCFGVWLQTQFPIVS